MKNDIQAIVSFPPLQRGVALVVALLFLLILTLLGVSALNTTSLQEKMAYNSKDRNIAFQAAETALITAENWIGDYPLTAPPDTLFTTANNPIGLYAKSITALPVWETATWGGANGYVTYPDTPTQTGAGSLAEVATQPKYVVELLSVVREGIELGSGDIINHYRITARGTGGNDSSVVMTQSVYRRVQ